MCFAWNPGLVPNGGSNLEGILRVSWLGDTQSLLPFGYNHCSWARDISQFFNQGYIVFILENPQSRGLRGCSWSFLHLQEGGGTVYQALLSNHCPARRIFRHLHKGLQVVLFTDTSDMNAATYMIMIIHYRPMILSIYYK